MTINSVNRNTDYILTTKATRSFFRWKALGENNSAVPGETAKLINSTAFLNLAVKYIWTDSDSCYLELGWEPWYLNENNQLVRFNDTDNYFSQEGLNSDSVYLIINGEPCLDINSLIPNTSPNTCRMIDLEENDTYIPIKCYEIIGIEGTNNLNVEYYYEYTDTSTNIKYYVDLTGKKGLKIPKVGKYDDNIVFNKDGLNELIDNIKKYPVIDIDTVPADQWANVSDGQPSIKVIHGSDPENPKYVKVGSNVTFEDSQKIILDYTETEDTQLNNNFNYYYQDENENYILIETQEELDTAIGNEKTIYKKSIDQKPGSFRANVNTDTFEVPVKGIEDVKVKNAEAADYYTESNGEKSELTIAEKFLKTGPVLLENQIIIISKSEEEAALENGNVIEYIIPQDIEVTRNSIVMITPVIADNPNEDLQIEEEPYNSSSWDIWAGCGIMCVQDPNYPRRIYFYLNEAIQDPELEEGSTIENPKIKIAINLAIFQNGTIYIPVSNEGSGSGESGSGEGSSSGESGSGEGSGNTPSGDLPDLTTFDPTTDFRSFSYAKNNETVTNKNFNEAVADGICALEINGDYWDFKILKDCSFTINKDISTTIFMVGGGASGAPATRNSYNYTEARYFNNDGIETEVDKCNVYTSAGGAGGNGGYWIQQNKELLKNEVINIVIGLGGDGENGKNTILNINEESLIVNGGEYSNTYDSILHNDTINEIGQGGNGQQRIEYARYFYTSDHPSPIFLFAPTNDNISSNMNGQQGILYHGNYYGAGGGGGGANLYSWRYGTWTFTEATYGHGGNYINDNTSINGDGGVYNINDDNNNHNAQAGAPNTGNGGGGGNTTNSESHKAAPGAGGSGIVIISNYT